MEALVRAVNSSFFFFFNSLFFFFKGTVLAIVKYRKTNGELEREGLRSYGGLIRNPTTPVCICFLSVVKGGGTDRLESGRRARGLWGRQCVLTVAH